MEPRPSAETRGTIHFHFARRAKTRGTVPHRTSRQRDARKEIPAAVGAYRPEADDGCPRAGVPGERQKGSLPRSQEPVVRGTRGRGLHRDKPTAGHGGRNGAGGRSSPAPALRRTFTR